MQVFSTESPKVLPDVDNLAAYDHCYSAYSAKLEMEKELCFPTLRIQVTFYSQVISPFPQLPKFGGALEISLRSRTRLFPSCWNLQARGTDIRAMMFGKGRVKVLELIPRKGKEKETTGKEVARD